MNKIAIFCIAIACFILFLPGNAMANLTKEQSYDVAEFATTFISEGNARRDDKGYPLLVYALSSNWNTCIEIRSKGYNNELYYIKNNRYHGNRELGYKWCMDCGDFMAFVYKTCFGFDLVNPDNGDPWHITDFRADANKGENSKYFEYIYKNVPISSIDESKLMPGDLVLRFGSKDNHGLVWVGEGWTQAHASYNAIRYDMKPPITGFQVVHGFYRTSTIVSIIRVKDGVVPADYVVNSKIVWPDNGEEQILTERLRNLVAEQQRIEMEKANIEPVVEETLIPDAENIILDNVSELDTKIEEKSIMLYIEEEMYSWMTEGLRRFYTEFNIDNTDEA